MSEIIDFDFYDTLSLLETTANCKIYLIMKDKKFYIEKIINKNNYFQNGYNYILNLYHKNIATIYQIKEDENFIHIYQEYAEGHTLEEILKEKNKLNLVETLYLSLQICEAIEYMHSQNLPIIHRDIKPSNIIVTYDNEIKIIDLGTARKIKQYTEKDTVCLGTSGYAAPEQFGYSQTDNRSDIYSIGVLIYQLLTGKDIINGKSLHTQINDNLDIIPNSISKILKKACAFDPENRYNSINIFYNDLKNQYNIYTKNYKYYIMSIMPGFRTHKLWKSIFGIIIYIIMFIWFIIMFPNKPIHPFYIFTRYGMIIILFALSTNFLNIWSYIPLFRKKIWLRISFIIIFVIIIFFISQFIN